MRRWITQGVGSCVLVLVLSGVGLASPTYVLTDLGTLGGTQSFALGINNSGQIFGYSLIKNDVVYHTFSYASGRMIDLGATALPPQSFLGQISASDPSQEPQIMGVVSASLATFGGDHSLVMAQNSAGQFVGYSWTAGNADFHAFLSSGKSIQNLDTNGGHFSKAYGINNEGVVVGATEYAGDEHAFVYSNGVMQDLASLIDANTGWRLDTAFAINDNGLIVGWGDTPAGKEHAFLLSPATTSTPEPTLAIFPATALVLALIRRSRLRA